MRLGEYFEDDYGLDDEYENMETLDGMDINARAIFDDNEVEDMEDDEGSAYYQDMMINGGLDLGGDDEDIIYEVDPKLLMGNIQESMNQPLHLENDNIPASQINRESTTSSGFWLMLSLGVIISIVTVLFVLYLAFKQRYQRLREEMDEKRQATIANQRARMAQMKQQMEAGNLIDAEALMFENSSSEEKTSVNSPFFEHGRRGDLDFSM